MANNISNLQIFYKDLIDPSSICSNPTITVATPLGVSVVCQDADSVTIQINSSIGGPYCLTFIVKCSTICTVCDDQVIVRCFCVNPGDCTNCSDCINNICVSRCPDNKICIGDTCGDCDLNHPCKQNQICNSQGSCICPSNLPIKRADGKCVQCIEGQTPLGLCEICIDGMIQPKNCPNGFCNPNTGNCDQCLNNSHCTGQNECCTGVPGQCKCCTGFLRNPITLLCEPAPKCVSQSECEALYGHCYTCEAGGCAPKKCPPGMICVNGNCVPTCNQNVPCPPGSGCINGGCVPCNQLSCTAAGLQCNFAIGCQCNSAGACEGVNCSPGTVSLSWVTTPGTPGQIQPGSGLPALLGTASVSATGIVYLQPPTGTAYQNHQFNLSITNGTSGTWTLENVPGQSISLGTGTNKSFDLTSTGPNLVGFIVKFAETGTSRTATWGFYREFVPLITPNVWHSEFQSTGTPSNTVGGTSGSLKLCANNGNFTALGVTDVVTTGSINITFYPDSTNPNCLVAVRTGCGIWNGKVVLKCGGQNITVQAPEISIDPSNCCDPADPNCGGWSTGDPCVTTSIQNIDIQVFPTYGTTGSGDGEFLAVADWASAGLTFIQMFYLNPVPACWSVSNNPESSNNDISIVTSGSQSPLGQSVSALSSVFTFGDGGCIRLGYTCELRIPGCKKLQGEKCMKECDNFSVVIVQTGPNTYTAVPSMNDEPINYVWQYSGLLNTSGQTVTITPIGGASTLTVTAFYGSPVKCNKSAMLNLNTSVVGCMNNSACNYNPFANADGTCVFVEAGEYDCVLGYQPGVQSVGIVTKIGSTVIDTNAKINPGAYTLDFYVSGLLKCSKPITIPQCYRCNILHNCIPAPLGNNQGNWKTADCDGACTCDIAIDIAYVLPACSNGRNGLHITATGDTGTYNVTVTNVGTGAVVLPASAMSDSGFLNTGQLCPGVYRVLVQGANCNNSKDFQVVCDTCTGSTLDLTNISHNCALTELTFTIVGAPCATNYNIQLLSSSAQVLVPPVSNNYPTVGVKHLIVGVRPAGSYIVRLTDNNGCVVDRLITICPTELPACGIVPGSVHLDHILVSGSQANFTASVNLNTNDGTYKVTLYKANNGSCPGVYVPVGFPIEPPEFISGTGLHTINFTNVTVDFGSCYAVLVAKTTDSSCNGVGMDYVSGIPPAVSCSGSVTGLSYDPLDGKVVVSWDFSNTTNNLTVQIQTGAGPACALGDPVFLTSTGNGEDGTNIKFGPLPQTQAGQFICVTIWDAGNPTCKASMTYTIPACTCGIDILSYDVHPNIPEIEVTYRAKCTSNLVDVTAIGSANGTLTNQATTTAGLWVTYTKVVTLSSYPSVGGTTNLQVIDQVNGLCQDNVNVVLPPNCTPCPQIASFYLFDTTVKTVKNFAGVIITGGTYALPGDEAALETVLYTDLIAAGANFCAGTPIDVSATRDSGVRIYQDSTDYQSLDHATIEHPDWASSKKVYFAKCGCSTTRVCDYTAILPIAPTAANIIFRYAENNPGGDYTGKVEILIPVPQTFSAGALAAIEATILAALTGTSCGNTVVDVTATYAAGPDLLTILVTGTNAGLGLINTYAAGSGNLLNIVDFTQSNCV